MAIYGALGEGFDGRGTRPGEYLSRGLATFASSSTCVVTVTAPIRLVTHVQATLKNTAIAGTDITCITVGNYSGNQFTIYAWKATNSSTTTLIAASGTWTVEWAAWGNVVGVDPVQNQP